MDIETIMTGAISRGLTLVDFKEMTIGQVVDYCIVYNNINTHDDKEKEQTTRKATQKDFDNF